MSVKDILSNEDKIKSIARKAFDNVDKDKSGKIDFNEISDAIKGIYNQMGLSEPSKEDIREVFDALDTDKSGFLDFNEFTKFIKDIMSQIH